MSIDISRLNSDIVNTLGRWLWRLLLRFEPYHVLMLFYGLAPMLIVHVKHTLPPDAFTGIDQLATWFGVSWWVMVALFGLMPVYLSVSKTYESRALGAIPILLYAFALLYGAIQGDIRSRGLLTILYLIVGSLALLVGTRQEAEKAVQQMAKKRAESDVQKLRDNLNELRRNEIALVASVTDIKDIIGKKDVEPN